MKKGIILSILLLAFLVGCESEVYQKYMAQGKKAMKADKYEEAIKAYQAALKDDPQSKDAKKALRGAKQANETAIRKEEERKKEEELAKRDAIKEVERKRLEPLMKKWREYWGTWGDWISKDDLGDDLPTLAYQSVHIDAFDINQSNVRIRYKEKNKKSTVVNTKVTFNTNGQGSFIYEEPNGATGKGKIILQKESIQLVITANPFENSTEISKEYSLLKSGVWILKPFERYDTEKRFYEARLVVRIGMREETARKIWGDPDRIRLTRDDNDEERERWAYDGRGNLYFKDGILVEIEILRKTRG